MKSTVMKKVYNAPGIYVLNLETTNSLLSGSTTITINPDGESVDAGNAAARGSISSSWDDEEGEEESKFWF